MAAKVFRFGANATMYFAPAGEASVVDFLAVPAVILPNIRNVVLTLDAEESDATVRAGAGWRSTPSTIRRCSCDFNLVCNSDLGVSDTGYEAFRDAFFNIIFDPASDYESGLVGLGIFSEPKLTVGSRGPVGDFYISGFNRSESTEGLITIDITAKLNRLIAYHIVV